MRVNFTEGELMKKYRQDESFKEEMDNSFIRYHQLREEAQETDLSDINDDLFVKLQNSSKNIYFYFGFLHDSSSENIHKLTLFFLKHFYPKPSEPYSFVFFNNKASYEVYGQLRTILLMLTIDHLDLLNYFVVVRSSLYHKAVDYMAYQTTSKYLRSKTWYKGSGQQMCKFLEIDPQDFVDVAPSYISQHQFPEIKPREIKLEEQRINFQGQRRNEDQKMEHSKFEESMKAFLFVKPGKEIYNLDDYEISKNGIPVVLQILRYYFEIHPEGLLKEGLFRKSVSIDDENQLLVEISQKNYDCLLEVTNPHLIASKFPVILDLIKRFFSNLKTPVFPFDSFKTLMHDQGIQDKQAHIKSVINSLPDLNYRSLLYLMKFLKEEVATNEKQNKMNTHNISICFSPCLMRSEKASPADLIYATKSTTVVEAILNNLEYMFGDLEYQQSVFLNREKSHQKQFQKTVEIKISAEKAKRSSLVGLEKTGKRISSNFSNPVQIFKIEEEKQPNHTFEIISNELEQNNQKKSIEIDMKQTLLKNIQQIDEEKQRFSMKQEQYPNLEEQQAERVNEKKRVVLNEQEYEKVTEEEINQNFTKQSKASKLERMLKQEQKNGCKNSQQNMNSDNIDQ